MQLTTRYVPSIWQWDRTLDFGKIPKWLLQAGEEATGGGGGDDDDDGASALGLCWRARKAPAEPEVEESEVNEVNEINDVMDDALQRMVALGIPREYCVYALTRLPGDVDAAIQFCSRPSLRSLYMKGGRNF